jgi:restriction system protein
MNEILLVGIGIAIGIWAIYFILKREKNKIEQENTEIEQKQNKTHNEQIKQEKTKPILTIASPIVKETAKIKFNMQQTETKNTAKIETNEEQAQTQASKEQPKPKLTRQEKIEKGNKYEIQVGKSLEEKGYTVDYRGLNLKMKDSGIDLIATKDDEIMLVQCKNWDGWKIKPNDLSKFYGDCDIFTKKNKLEQKYKIIKYRFVGNQNIKNNEPMKTKIKEIRDQGIDFIYRETKAGEKINLD